MSNISLLQYSQQPLPTFQTIILKLRAVTLKTVHPAFGVACEIQPLRIEFCCTAGPFKTLQVLLSRGRNLSLLLQNQPGIEMAYCAVVVIQGVVWLKDHKQGAVRRAFLESLVCQENIGHNIKSPHIFCTPCTACRDEVSGEGGCHRFY